MNQRRSMVRWLSAAGIVPLLAVGLANLVVPATQAATSYQVFNSPAGDLEGSEILDITPDNKYAVIVGSNNKTERKTRIITVDPTTGFVKGNSLDLTSAVANLGLTQPLASSVAIHPTAGYAIVTIRECIEQGCASPPATTQPGGAVFVNIGANGALSLGRATALPLGIQPESIDIAPNGTYAVIANEGVSGANGSVTILDLRGGVGSAAVATQFAPSTANPEPEAVAISPNSGRAFVTLQENNAVAVIDVDPATLNQSHAVTSVGVRPGTSQALYPDGVAVTPDNQYIVIGDEGITNNRANSVSMFRVGNDRSLTSVANIGLGANTNPEMVAIGTVAGQLKAFVSLEIPDAVATFNIGAGTMALETTVSLNPTGQPNALDPEGIALVNGMDLVVTANVASKNISVIRATSDASPSPSVSLSPRGWLPDVRR